jgi:glyoxylase-like metal-dependent hydrolase (beta-lactamase superfamily II)
MADHQLPDPVVQTTGAHELARDLVVIPNRRVDLVPNIGVIGGNHSVLVVETGLGPRNAEKVLAFASEYAKGRRLYLTTTHFHPEHAFGAQAFTGEATYLVNSAQAADLAGKGPGYLEMFRGLGAPVARQLEGVELAQQNGLDRDALTLPDGKVIAPTGKAFDVEFGQTTKWDGDQLIVISAFWDAALQRQQIGLA